MALLQFEVRNRFSGEVQFTAAINAKADDAESFKLGLAVKWAIENRANLTYADLTAGGFRSDGHAFFAVKEPDGRIMLRAGCRYFTFDEARSHWGDKDYRDARLGAESLAITDHLERMAKIAGWLSSDKQEAA